MKKISDRELYEIAEKARENAYAPYSGFRVGAALLTPEGRIYTGVNVENGSYGATICAERTALVKAVSEGERSFDAIAVSAGDRVAFPCGICRQFMSEFGMDIRIIVKEAGELVTMRLSELLPEAFILEGADKTKGGEVL